MNFLQIQQRVEAILNNSALTPDVKLFIAMAQETLEKELLVPDMRAYPAQLSTPVISSVTGTTGTLAAGTWSYRVSATDAYGETLASTAVTVTLGAPGGAISTWGAVTGAATYKVYRGVSGSELLLATVTAPTVTYTDNGSITPSGALPTLNTTYSLRTGQNTFPIPTDYINEIYLGFVDLTTGYSSSAIEKYSPEKFGDYIGIYPTTKTGMPSVFMRQGSNFVFDVYADKDYGIHMAYKKKLTALTTTSADNVTNFWTTDASVLLIYRACVESYSDDPMYAVWEKRYEDELRKMRIRLRDEVLGGNKQRFVTPNYFS